MRSTVCAGPMPMRRQANSLRRPHNAEEALDLVGIRKAAKQAPTRGLPGAIGHLGELKASESCTRHTSGVDLVEHGAGCDLRPPIHADGRAHAGTLPRACRRPPTTHLVQRPSLMGAGIAPTLIRRQAVEGETLKRAQTTGRSTRALSGRSLKFERSGVLPFRSIVMPHGGCCDGQTFDVQPSAGNLITRFCRNHLAQCSRQPHWCTRHLWEQPPIAPVAWV
jgi:hypothetical protein